MTSFKPVSGADDRIGDVVPPQARQQRPVVGFHCLTQRDELAYAMIIFQRHRERIDEFLHQRLMLLFETDGWLRSPPGPQPSLTAVQWRQEKMPRELGRQNTG